MNWRLNNCRIFKKIKDLLISTGAKQKRKRIVTVGFYNFRYKSFITSTYFNKTKIKNINFTLFPVGFYNVRYKAFITSIYFNKTKIKNYTSRYFSDFLFIFTAGTPNIHEEFLWCLLTVFSFPFLALFFCLWCINTILQAFVFLYSEQSNNFFLCIPNCIIWW